MLLIDQSLGGHSHSHSVEDSGHTHDCSNSEGLSHNHTPHANNVISGVNENLIAFNSSESTSNPNQIPCTNGHTKKHIDVKASITLPKSAAIILTAGLSVHNILEGVSIGLSPN